MVPIHTSTVGPCCVAVAAQGMKGRWNELYFQCTPEQFAAGMKAYKAGAHIQDAFPFLKAEEREFLISGITPNEWRAIFGKESE